MEMDVETECAICGQVLCVPVTTTCRHTFCRGCLSVSFFLEIRNFIPICPFALCFAVQDKLGQTCQRGNAREEWAIFAPYLHTDLVEARSNYFHKTCVSGQRETLQIAACFRV